jgi:cystathionine gamma-lyase
MTSPEPYGPGTRAVHAGLPEAVKGEPFLPGPVFAGTYHLPGAAEGPRTYGRYGNPTWTGLEAAIGDLEGAAATVTFASGMAAISAVLTATLRPGDTVVLPSDGYPGTREVGAYLEAHGIRVRHVPTDTAAILEAVPGARVVWLETPSNPGLDVCDIATVSDLARAGGALVVVDNTLATPLGQQPLALGADISVASGTKALTGHSDLLLGYASFADPRLADLVREQRRVTGGVPGPMEAWLAHRSIATAHLRVERQAANALAVARVLADRPDVRGVRHPGLPGDPAHALAAASMRAFGCVVSFTLADRPTAERFLAAARLVAEATSFGGVHTMAERRARWAGNDVPEGFVRLSAGCEDTADLVADVSRALDEASRP